MRFPLFIGTGLCMTHRNYIYIHHSYACVSAFYHNKHRIHYHSESYLIEKPYCIVPGLNSVGGIAVVMAPEM
jgi:hypothetical protein